MKRRVCYERITNRFKFFLIITSTSQICKSHQYQCNQTCHNEGICDQFIGECICRIGFSGEDCSIDNLSQCRYKGHLHHFFVYTTHWTEIMNDKPKYVWLGIVTCGCLQQLILDSGWESEQSNYVPCLDTDIQNLESVIKNPETFRMSWKVFNYSRGSIDLDTIQFREDLNANVEALQPLTKCPNECGDLGWCAQIENKTQCECVKGIATNDERKGCKCAQNPVRCHNSCSNRGECIDGNFCKCASDSWGIDCNFSWDESGKAVILSQTSQYETSGFEQISGSIQPGLHRPRIYIYNLPPEFSTLTHRHGWLLSRFLISKYRTHDPKTADYFLIPHSATTNKGQSLKLFEYIQNSYPYFNESISQGVPNHIMFMLMDKGPAHLGVVNIWDVNNDWIRPEWNWANSNRYVMGFFWNGRTDGAVANQSQCEVCFQPGKDILLPIPQGRIDGPLFGYDRSMLQQLSPWVNRTNIQEWPKREYVLFFAGKVKHANKPDDASGRGQLYHHFHNASNFLIVNSDVDEKVPLADFMATSVFCYVPYGTEGGDARRYMGAVLFGCIPVWFSYSDNIRQSVPLEELTDLPWYEASVFVTRENMTSLHSYLHSFTEQDIYKKRLALSHIVERLLYTSIDGALIGESGTRDAFQGIIKILGQRLQNKI
eukprot:TRINITY_DN5706_c0_g3_i1.p1 TRINITY_DN5706_c0_g3~~TRINITY_DN5706_c0_g3_i1.p1  ORF type:complete len:657 (-),score=12.16 TRINITY_DN5706_c0_g3_i1:543-2513(-)